MNEYEALPNSYNSEVKVISCPAEQLQKKRNILAVCATFFQVQVDEQRAGK